MLYAPVFCRYVLMVFSLVYGKAWAVQEPACPAQPPIPKLTDFTPILPFDCASTEQSPPDFSWPSRGKIARYRFVLVMPDGKSEEKYTEQNWIAWPTVLAPGWYSWRVYWLQSSGQVTPIVNSYRFKISENATPFVIPDWKGMYRHASSLKHPRALPQGEERVAWVGALLQERQGKL